MPPRAPEALLESLGEEPFEAGGSVLGVTVEVHQDEGAGLVGDEVFEEGVQGGREDRSGLGGGA